MKKLLIIALLTASTAQAETVSTADVKYPFIANGGFKGLCDRLGWDWGVWLSGGIDGGETYACLSKRYQKINRIDDFIKK
jgi:hypothetical protein